MAVKKVAAIIVAALVAGVVLGTLGVANAGNQVTLPGASADCTSCPGETGVAAECGDCTEDGATSAEAAPVAPQGAAAAAPAGACGTGECAGDCP